MSVVEPVMMSDFKEFDFFLQFGDIPKPQRKCPSVVFVLT
jgi:hypothetical protein